MFENMSPNIKFENPHVTRAFNAEEIDRDGTVRTVLVVEKKDLNEDQELQLAEALAEFLNRNTTHERAVVIPSRK